MFKWGPKRNDRVKKSPKERKEDIVATTRLAARPSSYLVKNKLLQGGRTCVFNFSHMRI